MLKQAVSFVRSPGRIKIRCPWEEEKERISRTGGMGRLAAARTERIMGRMPLSGLLPGGQRMRNSSWGRKSTVPARLSEMVMGGLLDCIGVSGQARLHRRHCDDYRVQYISQTAQGQVQYFPLSAFPGKRSWQEAGNMV